MLIPPDALIDGCVRALLESVLPDVSSRFARGQVYAVVDVLRNLQGRIEEKAALAATEADSLRAALGRARDALAGAPLASRLAAALDESASLAPPDAVPRLRAALVAGLEALHGDAVASEAEVTGARAALGAHVAAQAIRDLSLLKPSLLREISKG